MDYKGVLRIEARERSQRMQIGIADSGKGISVEIMPRIFQPFFTAKPAPEGSGLRLDIVKKIIDKHRGKIKVEVGLGKKTFTVSLPLLINSIEDTPYG